jgi:hypothetical protein
MRPKERWLLVLVAIGLFAVVGVCVAVEAAKPIETVPWAPRRYPDTVTADYSYGVSQNIQRASDELTAQLMETNRQLKRIADALEKKN